MKIKIAGIVNDSIVDGPGIRLSIFVQGCKHDCKDCHNPETHDLSGGYYIDIDDIIKLLKSNPLLSGITVSGGEPLLQYKEVTEILKLAKKLGFNTIVYTGFLFENIIKDNKYKELLSYTDLLVDGPFMIEEKSLLLKFKGSKNQRIIDVAESIKENKILEI